MLNRLENILAGRDEDMHEGAKAVWLDGLDFAVKVVRGGKGFDWNNVTDFVASYGQMVKLLGGSVAPVPVDQIIAHWLAANMGALVEMRGKARIRYALKKLLGMPGMREHARELVKALSASVHTPLVLVLPPNGNLINWANSVANQAAPAGISDIDVDTASVYLADLMRIFNNSGVAGVVVQLPPGTDVNPDLLELYSPIINVARHYGWMFGVEVADPAGVSDPEDKVGFVLSSMAPGAGTLHGGLIEDWNGDGISSADFHFGTVPADMPPEAVLARIKDLKKG